LLITLPITVRQALPAYGNELILMVKASSLISIITLMEITGIARTIISKTYAPVEIFLVAGSIYLIINFIIVLAVGLAERKLGTVKAN
jgi:octopine/nopaline transport system permease protein